MIWGYDYREGWFFTKNEFRQYQQCRGKVACYVEKMMYIYRANLYVRGVMTMCELEARTTRERGPDELFEICEIWLERYQDGDLSHIHRTDPFSIANPSGVWRDPSISESKLYYLNNYPNWRELYAKEAI